MSAYCCTDIERIKHRILAAAKVRNWKLVTVRHQQHTFEGEVTDDVTLQQLC
eukprot:SAG31_NODE_44956_length_260_cov_1.291925_1_plen_51_part_10